MARLAIQTTTKQYNEDYFTLLFNVFAFSVLEKLFQNFCKSLQW